MSEEFLLGGQHAADEHQFPANLNVGGVQFALEYQFDPGSGRDGVWIVVPVALLNRLEPVHLDWLVPGWLSDRIEALIRALPKAKRRNFVPVPDYVRAVMARLTPAANRCCPRSPANCKASAACASNRKNGRKIHCQRTCVFISAWSIANAPWQKGRTSLP